MNAFRSLFLSSLLAAPAVLALGPSAFCQQSVSSDDISVADGLQLPTYGHVWALDSWKGLQELVRLKPPDTMGEDTGFSLKLRRTVEFKGEAAMVRLHNPAPTFFVRGVSGGDTGRSDLVMVRLGLEGARRTVSKEGLSQLKQVAKQADQPYSEVILMKQQRVGATDWYKLTPRSVLAAGEYALLPLPTGQGFAEGELFDFAFDPEAPENPDPLRSEQYRGAK
jgi:hypothetical protein